MNAPIDVTGIRIETPRMILRPWHEADAEDLYEYASVPGVGEAAGWIHHSTIDESRMILASFIKHRKTFALELKENGKVIGSLGLEEIGLDPYGEDKLGREIGYVLSKDYWGSGLMTEAVEAIIHYCFKALNYDYLICGHFYGNDRSRRVVEKNGFQYFGDSDFETRYDTVEKSRNYVLNNPYK